MQKQTVNEVYKQQQIMNGETGIAIQAKAENMKELSSTFKNMEQAIMQTHQSVRQAQLAYPTDLSLQQAEQRLQYVMLQVQQFKSVSPTLARAMPKATQQQLNQLEHQLTQAGKTLQLIQKTLQSN